MYLNVVKILLLIIFTSLPIATLLMLLTYLNLRSTALKIDKGEIQRNFAKEIFFKKFNLDTNIINTLKRSDLLLEYLHSLLMDKERSQTPIFEATDQSVLLGNIKNLSFYKINFNSNSIDILLEPKSTHSSIKTVLFSDIENITIDYKTIFITDEKDRTPHSYYQLYPVSIKFNKNIGVRDIITYCKMTSIDNNGEYLENEARTIGEIFSEIFKIDLVDIDGISIKYQASELNRSKIFDTFTAPNFGI